MFWIKPMPGVAPEPKLGLDLAWTFDFKSSSWLVSLLKACKWKIRKLSLIFNLLFWNNILFKMPFPLKTSHGRTLPNLVLRWNQKNFQNADFFELQKPNIPSPKHFQKENITFSQVWKILEALFSWYSKKYVLNS